MNGELMNPNAGRLELTREQFIARLIKAGWPQHEAETEWDEIQNDEESGYDGP